MSDTVYCSDACLEGYALYFTRAPPDEVFHLAEVRERWRFMPEETRPAVLFDLTFAPGWEASWRAPPGLEL